MWNTKHEILVIKPIWMFNIFVWYSQKHKNKPACVVSKANKALKLQKHVLKLYWDELTAFLNGIGFEL